MKNVNVRENARERIARALLGANVHTEADDDGVYCGQVADAVLAVLPELLADPQVVDVAARAISPRLWGPSPSGLAEDQAGPATKSIREDHRRNASRALAAAAVALTKPA